MHIHQSIKAGGFTITSNPSDPYTLHQTPSKYQLSPPKTIQLAIQKSTTNPAAAFFWKDDALGQEVHVRVGGTFTWRSLRDYYPINGVESASRGPRNVLFIAGGMGINPLVSMIRYLYATTLVSSGVEKAVLLYASKVPSRKDEDGTDILFMEDLVEMIMMTRRDGAGAEEKRHLEMTMFLTGQEEDVSEFMSKYQDDNERSKNEILKFEQRRLAHSDIKSVVEQDDPCSWVTYVCGPPAMTDKIVKYISHDLKISKDRIHYEKWW